MASGASATPTMQRPSTASTASSASSVPVGGHAAASIAGSTGPPSPEDSFADDDVPQGPQRYLWEQISTSIDVVEREEIERVVGEKLVRECTDVYAEVRALQEILNEYSADTDALVRKCSSMPRSLGSQPAGLVQLELKSLVAQLRKRAAAAGKPEDALLPQPSSPQRKALEHVLQNDVERPGTASGLLRPGTADGGRVSLRDMRLASAGSRPGTASQPGSLSSRPGTSSGTGSRPATAAMASAPTGSLGDAGAPPPSRSGSCGGGCASRPTSRASGRPSSAASSTGSADSNERSSSSRGGGLVVSRLRAALEEERQALLAQAEGLRLAIDDEHDYRGKVSEPLPSLTSLLDLKRSLQAILQRQDQSAFNALAPPEQLAAQARGRAALSQHAPLPSSLPSREVRLEGSATRDH